MIGEPVSAKAAAEVNLRASDVMSLPLSPAEPLHEEVVEVYVPQSNFLSRYWKPLLGAGVAIYAITLALSSLSYLDVMLGWGLAIAGAALITVGVSHLYDKRIERKTDNEPIIGEMKHAGDEIVICPRCHEEVSEGDMRCPSCGAAFTH